MVGKFSCQFHHLFGQREVKVHTEIGGLKVGHMIIRWISHGHVTTHQNFVFKSENFSEFREREAGGFGERVCLCHHMQGCGTNLLEEIM